MYSDSVPNNILSDNIVSAAAGAASAAAGVLLIQILHLDIIQGTPIDCRVAPQSRPPSPDADYLPTITVTLTW